MWFIIELAICALAGWATGQIMKGSGYGLIGDVLLGIVGGWIGGFLLGSVMHASRLTDFLVRVIGAVIAVALLRLFLRKI